MAGDADALRPQVASTRTGTAWPVIGAAVVAGLLAFVWLNGQRVQRQARDQTQAVPVAGASDLSAPSPPPDVTAVEAAARTPATAPPPAFVLPVAPTTPAPILHLRPSAPPGSPPGATAAAEAQRRRAPTLVVDLAEAQPPPAATSTAPAGTRAAAGVGAPAPALNGDEQFAERVGGAEPERARATMLRNPSQVIPQGAMIPAVLETALNSDLPGFVRAVVSRDVRGFDGANVLIPRGSRLIGQYRSGVALGQSRAFVIWTRVLRPDGASVQIGSPGTDPLGRGGFDGEVNRHFFQRFSGSILLSVINAGVQSLVSRPSTQIVIGSTQDATALGAAAIVGPTNIPPTIKVAQGSPIQIFVAKDLDFSGVGSDDK